MIAGRDLEAKEEEARKAWQEMSVAEHLQKYLDEGLDEKAAMKAVAEDRGVPKREIYRELKT